MDLHPSTKGYETFTCPPLIRLCYIMDHLQNSKEKVFFDNQLNQDVGY